MRVGQPLWDSPTFVCVSRNREGMGRNSMKLAEKQKRNNSNAAGSVIAAQYYEKINLGTSFYCVCNGCGWSVVIFKCVK